MDIRDPAFGHSFNLKCRDPAMVSIKDSARNVRNTKGEGRDEVRGKSSRYAYRLAGHVNPLGKQTDV